MKPSILVNGTDPIRTFCEEGVANLVCVGFVYSDWIVFTNYTYACYVMLCYVMLCYVMLG